MLWLRIESRLLVYNSVCLVVNDVFGELVVIGLLVR